MRMMLKVQFPVEAGNAAIQSGDLPNALEGTMERLKPEATYFVAEDGMRTALIFFDMAEASDIPVIVEPFMMGMNAAVHLQPVMNADDLQKGLSQLD